VNEIDPANVGIYGIGIAPRTEGKNSGPEGVFFAWTGTVSDVLGENESPGVYIPNYDNAQLSDRMMDEIAGEMNTHDVSGLREDQFSDYARSQYPSALDNELEALFPLFSAADLTWEPLSEEPVVREAVDGDGQTLLLLPIYRVSSGGKDYWLFFADFTVNTIDPENLGLYAIGVAPRTASGDSPEEQALFAWADTFDVDATAPAGIFIPQ